MRRSSARVVAWTTSSLPQWRFQDASLRWHGHFAATSADVKPHLFGLLHTSARCRRQTTLRENILAHDPVFAFDASPSDGFGDVIPVHAHPRSGLAAMDDGQMVAHCREVASFHLRDAVEDVLAHFENLQTLAQPVASTSSSSPLPSLTTYCMHALLEGNLNRYNADARSSSEQLLRILQVLRRESSRLSGESSPFAFLSSTLARRLGARLGSSKSLHLFPIFHELQRKLMEYSDLADFPNHRELSRVFRYALQPTLWRQGGMELVKLHLDRLVSREADRPIIIEAGHDARAWLGSAATEDTLFELFAFLFALRLSIQQIQIDTVSEYCGAVMQRFLPLACNTSVASEFLINTSEALCRVPSYGTPQGDSDGLASSLAILKEHSAHIAPALGIDHSIPGTTRFSVLCDLVLAQQRFENFSDLLLHYQKIGFEITDLISPFQLIRLVRGLSIQAGKGAALQVAQLVRARDGKYIEQKLLHADFPAKRYLLAALIKAGLKDDVAWVWKHWTQIEGTDNTSFRRDVASVLGIVRLFTQKSWTPTGEPGPEDARSVRQRQIAQEEQNFALEVLQTFTVAKTGERYSHFELTSLAVARYHLQQHNESLNSFKQLLCQREIPDETDILVLLRAIGQHDHQQATEIYLSYIADQEHEASAAKSPSFQGVRPTADVFEHLLRMAYSNMDFEHADKILCQARSRLPRPKWGPIVELLTLTSFSKPQHWPSCAWYSFVPKITAKVANKLHSNVWNAIVIAAANGVTLPFSSAREKLKAEGVERTDPRMKLRVPRDGNLIAAVDLLYLDTPYVLLHRDAFLTVLDKLSAKAGSLQSRSRKPDDKELSRWLDQIDKFVASLRKTQNLYQRHRQGLKLARQLGTDAEPEILAKDRTTGACAGEEELSTSQPSIVSTGRRSTGPLLDVSVFRKIIDVYLRLGDISGASQVFLWMKMWDPKTTVGAMLGAKLRMLLGDLEFLNRGVESPSWTFEGKRIEKTKMWWQFDAELPGGRK